MRYVSHEASDNTKHAYIGMVEQAYRHLLVARNLLNTMKGSTES